VGTDEKVLVEIFSTRPRRHLQEVKKEFHTKFGKTLESWIKGDCSGNLEKILLDLCEDRNELKCKYIRNATQGIGTNEQVLIEILCPATNEKLKKIDQTYQKLYKTDLATVLKSELSGDLQKLMLNHIKADRPSDSQVDEHKAKADAETLFKEGEGKIGTNEDVFTNIITSRSKAHLEHICRHYEQLTGHTLERGLKSETSYDYRHALLAIMMPEAEYYAHLFNQSMKGGGTEDDQLIRLMSTLTKKQLKEANAVFTKKHQRTLVSAIKSETSGSYQQVLLGLVPSVA